MMNRYDHPDFVTVQRTLDRQLLYWYVRTADVTPWEEDLRGYARPWVGAAHPDAP